MYCTTNNLYNLDRFSCSNRQVFDGENNTAATYGGAPHQYHIYHWKTSTHLVKLLEMVT